MIYDEPRILPAGDCHLLMEFGNEMNLELNFRAQGLATALETSGTKGVVETAPCFASLLVHYDPDAISYTDLGRELRAIGESLGPPEELELDSRLFVLPTCYLDPWTREAIEDYGRKIAPKEWDPAFVARINGLDSAEQLVRVHAGTEYWVAALGFWPGLPFMMALDPRCLLTAPKYDPPRLWTPQGTVGMGGSSTAIYPVATPGGYQIFARTPVPIWDTEKRFDVFGDDICLFRAGDRVRFVPVGADEFTEIEARVAERRYVFNVVDYQRFSVRNYKRWLATLDRAARF
ncbi:MAG: transporter [Proteobacteria bacterium]|nr:MAG: transporter [Pseudomonadota bacterium]